MNVDGEADVQAETLLAATTVGVHLMRNNSGVAFNPKGQPVRFGLGNVSKKYNEVFKSPDLVGISPDGFFLGVECKEPGWKYRGTKREIAQLNALNLIRRKNGFGVFINDPALFIPLYQMFRESRINAIFGSIQTL